MAGGRWPGKAKDLDAVPFSPSNPPAPPRGNLIPIKPIENLADTLDQLEQAGGNLDTFLFHYRGCETLEDKERELYFIMRELEKDKERLKKWDEIIEKSAKLRLRLLQTKALGMLEKFNVSASASQSPIVAYCNLMLGDMLLTRNESAKRSLMPPVGGPNPLPPRGGDVIDDDLAMLGDDEDE